ncbi:hypothetical protein [Breoghania sp.]|uniref:hypothetical protein n=1 Tax=Breoghania sp. TaxID=2065378 RepID=UPI0029CA6835|nr:hypothetical protein [Breoghania sp.]
MPRFPGFACDNCTIRISTLASAADSHPRNYNASLTSSEIPVFAIGSFPRLTITFLSFQAPSTVNWKFSREMRPKFTTDYPDNQGPSSAKTQPGADHGLLLAKKESRPPEEAGLSQDHQHQP